MTIDDELAAAGARWRAGLDADPSLEELFATSRSRRQRRPIGPMLAAAALIIAVGIVTVLVATRHDPAPAGDTPAPVHPAQCADDFSVILTPTPVDVPAAAASTAEIRLRYAGRATCSIPLDIASVDLIRQGAPEVTVYDTSGRIGAASPAASVAPGDEFDTTLTWSSYCGASPVTAFRLHLGDHGRGVDVPIGQLATPTCARKTSTPLLVTALMPTSDTATLRIGIRYVGGPAPGNNPALVAGTVVVSLGSEPYRTAVVTAGERTTVVVAGIESGSYQVTGTSGDANCLPQSITPAADTVSDLTLLCSVD
jgi:hypothetical protein